MTEQLPDFDDLVRRPDAPDGSSWHVYGRGDQLGSLNNLTPETTVRAARLVRTGQVFNLDYPINTFVPSMAGTRPATQHTIFANNPHHRDDWLDSFYLQSTSQIDGLRHIRDPRHGFYGGVSDDEIVEGRPALGIQLVAERGVMARGVLLDLGRHFERQGRPLDLGTNTMVHPKDLDEAAAAQEVELAPGDVLLLRFGWADYYLSLPPEDRPLGRLRSGNPGLVQSDAMLRWIWNHHLSLICADNSGLEATPISRDSGWINPDEPAPGRGPSHNGLMHRPLIALLGVWIGELWRLEDLARACADDGVYEFLLSAKPLNLVGGVGSPPNAMAVK